MATWKRKPQECEGNYWFEGQLFVTYEVQADIPKEEIIEIVEQTLQAVEEHGGLDYLQVFENDFGNKLYFIASASKEMIESGEFDPNDIEYNSTYPHF
ncbi:hypothetical protein [Lacihabitans lacunae]|uniref:Uncharacterized protein n=1 Tax=Lacihabitans lacunae TaxID=1028214 RepID=A0ABV7Z179_9BACT